MNTYRDLRVKLAFMVCATWGDRELEEAQCILHD